MIEHDDYLSHTAVAGEGSGKANTQHILQGQDEDGSYMVPTKDGGSHRVYPHPEWKPGEYVRNISRGNYTGRVLLNDGHGGINIFRDDGEWDAANASDCERVSADEGRELRAATAAKAEVRADTLRTAIAQLQTMLNLELRVIKMIQSSENTN